MKKLRNYFIGEYLAKTENVFTRSKIGLLYNFIIFYLVNVILFWGNVISHHYYYHAGILGFNLVFLVVILIVFKKKQDYRFAGKLLLINQTVVGIVSYIIQQSTMDFVGEFFIMVNILIAFFILDKKYGFIMTGFWLLQLIHCLANDLSGGKFILIHIPQDQVLPPAPFFVLVPFFLCVYIIYEFVKTRAVAEHDIQMQKGLLENKNKEITDSITYAKRIQSAMLPKKEDIHSLLKQSFVLFKPKDIVSGDFYFFTQQRETVFIAAADCTGHGVPGAFMSLIGSEKLNDAVAQNQDTSEILKQLNKGIKISLRQSESNESTRDGMDIALCSIDLKNNLVKYAGANRPIWIIRNGSEKVEEIKATKKAIGGLTGDDQFFDTHEIKLQQGDAFYIFSDGYADQFNGPDGKKLTTKKFKELLLKIQKQSMPEQEKQLENFIENWKRGSEQIDDILVMGVRV